MSSPINEKHLELLQNVVDRMAGNSFALKRWSVVLVAALLALASKDADTWLVAIALFPALTFWGLDGYFLAQERLFRDLYNRLIDSETGSQVPAYSLKTEPFTSAAWVNATFSLTLRLFHGAVVLVIIGALIFLRGVVPAA